MEELEDILDELEGRVYVVVLRVNNKTMQQSRRMTLDEARLSWLESPHSTDYIAYWKTPLKRNDRACDLETGGL